MNGKYERADSAGAVIRGLLRSGERAAAGPGGSGGAGGLVGWARVVLLFGSVTADGSLATASTLLIQQDVGAHGLAVSGSDLNFGTDGLSSYYLTRGRLTWTTTAPDVNLFHTSTITYTDEMDGITTSGRPLTIVGGQNGYLDAADVGGIPPEFRAYCPQDTTASMDSVGIALQVMRFSA